MPRELINANITHVSYVDKAANKRKFFLTKSEDKPVFEKQVKVLTKADDEQKLVYGVVYEPGVEDTHGDFMTSTEIEKAAHAFLKDSRNIDTQHDFVEGVGEVVESYVAPADFMVGEQAITKGSWVLVTKATDEIWDSIQKGDITGYSMAGVAETVEDQPVSKSEKLFSMLKSFFLGEDIQKGEVQDRFDATKLSRDFWAAKNIFDDVFYDEIWTSKDFDAERVGNAAKDFAELLLKIAGEPNVLKAVKESKPEPISKSGRAISAANMDLLLNAQNAINAVVSAGIQLTPQEGETEVTKEELQAVMKEALDPVTSRLDALEKVAEPAAAEKEEAVVPALTAEAVAEVVKSAVAPIAARLEVVEKARGIKKSEEADEPAGEPIKKSVWDGLL